MLSRKDDGASRGTARNGESGGESSRLQNVFPLLPFFRVVPIPLACSCGQPGLFTTRASKRSSPAGCCCCWPLVVVTRYNSRPRPPLSTRFPERGGSLPARTHVNHSLATVSTILEPLWFMKANYLLVPFASFDSSFLASSHSPWLLLPPTPSIPFLGGFSSLSFFPWYPLTGRAGILN